MRLANGRRREEKQTGQGRCGIVPARRRERRDGGLEGGKGGNEGDAEGNARRGSRAISGSERTPRAREAKRVAQRGRRGAHRAL